MEIRLRPELEALIQQEVQRGPYQSVDEFVEQAVKLLHEQETCLAANRSEIEHQILEGYAASERGELIDAEEVHAQLNKRKLEHTSK